MIASEKIECMERLVNIIDSDESDLIGKCYRFFRYETSTYEGLIEALEINLLGVKLDNFAVGFVPVEDLLENIFIKHEESREKCDIAAKVIALDKFYSTRLGEYDETPYSSLIKIIGYICDETFDNRIVAANDCEEVVDIVNTLASIGGKDNHLLSFASKYCSCVSRYNSKEKKDIFPIIDSYTKDFLYYYNKVKKRPVTRNILDEYRSFICYVDIFRRDLKNEYGYRELDTFMWIIGKALSKSIK